MTKDGRTPQERAATTLKRAVVLAALATFAGFGGGLFWGFDLFAHFRVQYALFGAVLVLPAVAWREWRAAVLAMVVVAVNLAVVAPDLALSPTRSARAAEAADLRLATLNVNWRNQDLRGVVDFVTAEAPDVIAFQEVTPWWESVLVEALGADYPYRRRVEGSGVHGVAIFSRLPLEFAPPRGEPDMPVNQAMLEVGGRSVTVIAVHLWRPGLPPRSRRQLEQVDEVVRRVRAAAPGSGVVVLGDFNATPWSEPYRRLADGAGLTRGGTQPLFTWPADLPPLYIPIDHVLVSGGLEVSAKWTGSDVGSDHLAQVAEIRFTR